MKDYYQILGIDQNCSKDEVKRAFRLYASKFHPDKQSGDKFFEERFKEIYEAYEILFDDQKRSQYDASIKSSSKNKTAEPSPNSDYLRKKERDLLVRESELIRKEAEIRLKEQRRTREGRAYSEYELSKISYLKDSNIDVNGLNVQIGGQKYLYENYLSVKSGVSKQLKQDEPKKGSLLFGTAGVLFLIGLFTSAAGIGLLFIFFGIIIVVIGLIRLVIVGVYNTIKDSVPKYQISLIGKYREDVILISNKSRIEEIEDLIKIALQKYYAKEINPQ